MFYAAALVVLTLDRLSKHYARCCLQGHKPVPIIPGILHLTYSENYGAAFGMLQYRRWFFVAITMVIIVGIVLYTNRLTPGKSLERLGLGILLGGAMGNLVDRILRGWVVDFIKLPYWPVFNVADTAIVVGVTMVAVLNYLDLRAQLLQEQGSRANG